MTGFELQTSGIGSNCSTNWETTTSHILKLFRIVTTSLKLQVGWENFFRLHLRIGASQIGVIRSVRASANKSGVNLSSCRHIEYTTLVWPTLLSKCLVGNDLRNGPQDTRQFFLEEIFLFGVRFKARPFSKFHNLSFLYQNVIDFCLSKAICQG